MSDYIMNRESLKRHCEAMCHKFKDIPTSGTYGEHRLVLELLEQSKWIPVTEKLPEDEQEVLITYKINVKHHVWSAIWDKLHGRFYDKEYRSYISLNYVTAWMPLPEPYQPQEISDHNLKMWHDIYEEEKRRTESEEV